MNESQMEIRSNTLFTSNEFHSSVVTRDTQTQSRLMPGQSLEPPGVRGFLNKDEINPDVAGTGSCSRIPRGHRHKKGSSRNSGKHRNKNADLIDDVRASKHI
ncbi:hypothetical protein [Pseudomonas chlororaphis]|uniref:hypothetical protein n=1 Tax=Pseudomonas chlororaphis TaxID=587753 RepID=UPI0024079B32|nr:hypothetical protein [Pseudomonas chlororaphis]